MLFIFLDIRYQRQLARICPDVLSFFMNSLGDSVRRNGGTDCKISSGFLCRFDTDSVGYAFSASRVIADLQQLLASNRARFQNYFVLVDAPAGPLQPDVFLDSIAEFRNDVYPEEGILVTKAAGKLLEHYCSTVPVQGTRLSFFTGPKGVQYSFTPEHTAESKKKYALHVPENGDPVHSVMDLVLLQDDLPAGSLSPEERKAFAETARAVSMYRKYRFALTQTEYRINACLEHAAQYFRALKNSGGGLAEIELHVGAADSAGNLSPRIQSVLGKFGDCCTFRYAQPLRYMPPDVKNIPDDLLELVWIAYKAMEFLFACEMPDLFRFLGKNAEFVESLGNWMYTYGVLADPRDFRTLNQALRPKVEARLASRIGFLSRSIANYAWSCYENGNFLAVPYGYRILANLGYAVPDHFIVRCMCSAGDSCISDAEGLALVKNRLVGEGLAKLDLAGRKFREGAAGEARVLAKEALLVFQKERMNAAEYRVFSLMSLFSLEKKDGADAIVYAEYALENALALKDPYIIIQARFDLAVLHFLNGNLHFALCSIDAAEKVADDCYVRDWAVPLAFMRARVRFELGDYLKAESDFKSAESLASSLGESRTECLCRVWTGRCAVHQNRFQAGERIIGECSGTVNEALIYLLESAVLSGGPRDVSGFPAALPAAQKSPDASAAALAAESFRIFYSSFSLAEDVCFGSSDGGGLAHRMYAAFLTAARCLSNPRDAGVSAVAELVALAQTALEEKDPYAGLYYYLCFEAGSAVPGFPQKDTELFLSKSFKSLQLRAKEISDNALREQFMLQPAWNSRLYRAAREHMLI